MRNIRHLFLKYVLLNIAGMMGLSGYILADTFFVARGVGAEGLTALNLAIPIYSLISGTGLMIGMGGAARFSLSKSKRVFTHSVYFTAFAACIFLVCSMFSKSIASIIGADKETLNDTSIYIRTILLFSPAFLLNNCVICFVRNDKKPRLAMFAMLLGSFSNIIFDYIFIFLFGMRMFGAALATGVAPIISLAVLSSHFIKHENTFHLQKLKPASRTAADIAALGASSFINEISSGVVIIAFNISILKIAGNTGVAAYGIVANTALVVISVFTGISQGIQPIVSSCCHKEDINGVFETLKYGLITAVAFAVIIYALSFVFAEPIVRVFNRNNDFYLESIAEKGLRIYFTSFIFSGVNIICAVFFGASNKPKNAFMISFMRGFAVIIPMLIVLALLFGMNGIWLSATASEFVVFLIAVILLLKMK